MDSSMMTAMAAAIGSLVGASASIVTTWITQRRQTIRDLTAARLREREALYGEFITEASHLVVDALTHSLERPETFVKLYGILGRIRLVCDKEILAEAEHCCFRIVELYSQPNLTTAQITAAFQAEEFDPLKAFSTRCRKELFEISGLV